jgi:hypothetical protein
MPIIAALITASVALLVPFISFYLNRSAVPPGSSVGSAQPLTVSQHVRLLVVIPAGLVLSVPAGLSAFGAAVIFNALTMPGGQDLFLLSLDAGLTTGAVFILAFALHAGFEEPSHWWSDLPFYPIALFGFFSTFGFMVSLVSNSIWAMALGIQLDSYSILFDCLDASLCSGTIACLTAFICAKIEELRRRIPAPPVSNSKLSAAV